jgi:hypothetical protein
MDELLQFGATAVAVHSNLAPACAELNFRGGDPSLGHFSFCKITKPDDSIQRSNH